MADSGTSPLAEELLVERQTSDRKLALDVGCSVGRSFLPLHRAGFDIVGIDPIMAGLRICLSSCEKNRLTAFPIRATSGQVPLRSGSVDFILAIGVLFHLSPHELDLALQSIKRVMKPNGEAILHFLGLHDWRQSLAKAVLPEQVPYPSYTAVVTSFCSEEIMADRLTFHGLKIASLELKARETEKGIREDWIACCRKE